MSWNLKEIKGASQKFLVATFREQQISGHGFHLKVETESAQEIPVSKHFFCCCMHRDMASVNSRNSRGIPDMVVMTVSQE